MDRRDRLVLVLGLGSREVENGNSARMTLLRAVLILVCVAAPLSGPSAAAAAACSTTGAGDQQYCDPLAGCRVNCGGTTASSHNASAASSPSKTNAGSPNSSASAANGSATAGGSAGGSTTSSGTGATANGSSHGQGGSLPFTGIDVAVVALLGAGMVAGGYQARRLTRGRD